MVKEIIFRGEKFLHFPKEKILLFHIREPFYSAGKQFGWKGAPIALGINKQALNYALENNLKIRVVVGSKNPGRSYEILAEEWEEFSLKHGAIMKKGKTVIYVCQWTKEHFKTILESEQQ